MVPAFVDLENLRVKDSERHAPMFWEDAGAKQCVAGWD